MPTADELLHAPLLKLERANQHINDLNVRCEAFLAQKPFKWMERINREAGKITYWVKTEMPIPEEFSLIIGDALHNTRAALDMVLYGMVGSVEPKVHFPVAREPTPESLEAAIDKGRIKVAGKKVVETVRRLEPYPTGDGTPLYTAHALDIRDKHHLLILTGRRAMFHTGTAHDEFIRPFIKGNVPAGKTIVIDTADERVALTVNKPFVLRDLPVTEKEADVQPTFMITFGDSEGLPGLPVVQVLRHCSKDTGIAVRAIVAAFLDPDNDPHI